MRIWSRNLASSRPLRPRAPRRRRARLARRRRACLFAIPAALGLAAPALAEPAWAVVSFDTVPVIPVGSADFALTFDPGVLAPILAGDPAFPTSIEPILCDFAPLPEPCSSAAGAAIDLPSANAIAAGRIEIAILSLSGVSASGDLFAIAFDSTSGADPQLALEVGTITDPTSAQIDPQSAPTIGLRFVPEPGTGLLSSVATAACLALARGRRSRASSS